MTMYRMQQREMILVLVNEASSLRRIAARSGRGAPRDGLRRAHAHAAGAGLDRRALPAGGRRAARARRASGCGRRSPSTNRNPLGACAITGTGFPIDRAAHDGAARLRRRDRQYLRQHRHGRLSARERVGGRGAAGRAGPGGPGPAAVVHGGGRLSAARRRLRAVAAASCRRSATRSRSSTRARSPARRSARRRRSCWRSTTRRSATSSTPRTICSRSWRRCSATRRGPSALVAAAMCGAAFDRERMAERARAGLDHGDRARRYADARARRAVQGEPSRRRRGSSPRRRSGRPKSRRRAPARKSRRLCLGGRFDSTTTRLAEVLSPEYFVRVRTTPGGPAPARDRARADRRRHATPTAVEDEDWLRLRPSTEVAGVARRAWNTALRFAVGASQVRGSANPESRVRDVPSRSSLPSAARCRAAAPRAADRSAAGP